jgi:micrococcal nuclease
VLRFVPTLVVFLICGLNTALANEVSGEARVRDADTIVVSGTPVRLNGIDAPENSTRAGMAATQFMKRLLQGETVACDLNGERTYDRWVGVCHIKVDGRWSDIGAILVSNGHALDCRRYSGGRYRALEPTGARGRLKQASYC